MKRSAQIRVPLLASVALTLLTACRDQEMKRCVNATNTVVDDSFCNAQQQQQQQQPPYSGGGHGYYPYRWYYGGGGGYGAGGTVSGGSFEPASGHSYATSTERGGFGGGFGEGGEGGHGGGAGE